MVYPIVMKNDKDVYRLNKVASQCPYDLTISSIDGPMVILNAKSLLGLFSLIGRNVYLVAPDHSSPVEFEKIIKQIKL